MRYGKDMVKNILFIQIVFSIWTNWLKTLQISLFICYNTIRVWGVFMYDKKAGLIYNELKKIITNPVCELQHDNTFQLLIAVMLSAQCTDKRVNSITPKLFELLPTPEDFVQTDIEIIENIIKPCGFYQNKAKNIKNCCKKLVEVYNGQVPSTMEELLTLDGVGRKTASVVLAVGFGIPAIAVDTHVQRVSNRIGLVSTNNVVDTEKKLKQLYKAKDWAQLHHTLLLYGRYYCKARNPQCEHCVVAQYCQYKKR